MTVPLEVLERGAEPGYGHPHGLLIQGRKAEQQTMLGLLIAVVDRDRLDVDAVGEGRGRDGSIVPGRPEGREDLHAGIVRRHRDPSRKPFPAEIQEDRLTTGIEPAHALQMRGEVALLDEVGQRRLQEKGRELTGNADRPADGVRQFTRHDKKADPQG